MPWHKPAPAFLVELVSREPPLGPNRPTILDWAEKDGTFIVVLEDGRKLTFRKLDPSERRRDFTPADVNPARSSIRIETSGVKEHVASEKPARKKKD